MCGADLIASSSLDSGLSMAIIRPAPASAAPFTATSVPGSTLAELNTVPVPVMTAQPMMEALSSGISPGINGSPDRGECGVNR